MRRGGQPGGGPAGVEVDAVGLANQGETVLAWDRATGRPLSPAISWQDRRSAAICERLARPTAERLVELTGLPLDPVLRGAEDALAARSRDARRRWTTTTDAWLLHRLSGAFVTDAATASRTLLLDLDTGPGRPRLRCFGRSMPTSLPRSSARRPVGETTAFGSADPVAGLRRPAGRALRRVCSRTGRRQVHVRHRRVPARDRRARPAPLDRRPRRLRRLAAGGRPTYCLDGQVYTAAPPSSWLERLGLIAEPADLDGSAGRSRAPSGAHLRPRPRRSRGAVLGAAGARRVRSGSRSPPSAAAPRARRDRRASPHRSPRSLGAVADDLGAPLARLRVDGGLTRSRALMQTQADLLQAPVEVYPSPDATALGVAALARLGCRRRDRRPGRRAWRRGAPGRVYEPRIGADEADGAAARRWRRRRDRAATLVAAVERRDDRLRRRRRRRRRRRHRDRARALAATAPRRAARSRRTTSAPGRARPTPPSCTRASTRSRARSSRASSGAATRCSRATRRGRHPDRADRRLLVAWNDAEQPRAAPASPRKAARTATRRPRLGRRASSTRTSRTSGPVPPAGSRSPTSASSARSRRRSPSRPRPSPTASSCGARAAASPASTGAATHTSLQTPAGRPGARASSSTPPGCSGDESTAASATIASP